MPGRGWRVIVRRSLFAVGHRRPAKIRDCGEMLTGQRSPTGSQQLLSICNSPDQNYRTLFAGFPIDDGGGVVQLARDFHFSELLVVSCNFGGCFAAARLIIRYLKLGFCSESCSRSFRQRVPEAREAVE
ncbi:Unknown protein, partial [Striga hermonthica]